MPNKIHLCTVPDFDLITSYTQIMSLAHSEQNFAITYKFQVIKLPEALLAVNSFLLSNNLSQRLEHLFAKRLQLKTFEQVSYCDMLKC